MEGGNLDDLIKAVKRECNITWSDEKTEASVIEIVENAIPTMLHKLGIKNGTKKNFEEPGLDRTLFLKYCLYDWNKILDEFETNYKREILTQRHKYEVEYGKEEKAEQLQ